MKNLRRLLCGLLALALLPTCSALAGARQLLNNAYMGVEGGYAISYDINFEHGVDWTFPAQSFKNDMGSSPVYGIKLGYRFTPAIRADLSYNLRNNFSWHKWFLNNGVNQRLRKIDKIKNQTIMANIYFTPKLTWGAVKPYVNAGAGISINKLGQLTSIVQPTGQAFLTGKTTTSFAWQVGAGTDVRINHYLAFNLGYRFIDIGKMQTGNTIIIPGIGPVGNVTPLVEKHSFLNEFYLGLTLSK